MRLSLSTSAHRTDLCPWRDIMARSTLRHFWVSLYTNFFTHTSFVCPDLWHRAMAWSSVEGFQEGDMMYTLVAHWMFRPTPPHLICTMSTLLEGAAEKISIRLWRSSFSTFPSMRNTVHMSDFS